MVGVDELDVQIPQYHGHGICHVGIDSELVVHDDLVVFDFEVQVDGCPIETEPFEY